MWPGEILSMIARHTENFLFVMGACSQSQILQKGLAIDLSHFDISETADFPEGEQESFVNAATLK